MVRAGPCPQSRGYAALSTGAAFVERDLPGAAYGHAMDVRDLRVDVYRHAQFGADVQVRVTHLPTGLTASAAGQGQWRVRQAALVALKIALKHNAKLAEIAAE